MDGKDSERKERPRIERAGILSNRDAEWFSKVAEAHTRRVTVSREAALEYLVELGTHNPDGTLTERFR